jgi:hypothetical protein
MHQQIVNDEPATTDELDRLKLARALVAVIEQCGTPLVVGLYGTWGTGKTSLMRIVEAELRQTRGVKPVWFDAWQHQFDESPVVALLHTMVDGLDLGEEGRKLLHVIAGALGGLLLKTTTTLNSSEIRELSDRYDDERFLIREKQIRLRAHFAELLGRATDGGQHRLVFFIDDLDRCVPEQVLRVLEALKLFLNMPGCVYVLGVDRTALEASIRHRYQGIEVSEAEYLDKIVQLPFTIPPIAASAIERFVTVLLPETLQDVVPDLVECLGENPRQVKRFVNTFLLNHELADEMLGERYKPTHLAAVLLLQYRKPELFKRAIRDPAVFNELGEHGESGQPAESWLVRIGTRLKTLHPDEIAPYVYLSEVASVRDLRFDVVLTSVGEHKIQVVKVVRQYTGLSILECKELVDTPPPTTVHTLGTREEAQRMVADLVEAGGAAEVE